MARANERVGLKHAVLDVVRAQEAWARAMRGGSNEDKRMAWHELEDAYASVDFHAIYRLLSGQ